jgi:hypothetical protein
MYETYFLTRIGYQGETKINSVEVHPQLNNNRHPVDGVSLVGAGSLVADFFLPTSKFMYMITQLIDISDLISQHKLSFLYFW